MRFLLIGLILIQLLWASERIKVEGRLSVKGHEPFTYLALTESGGKSYKIIGEHKHELYRLQGHIIRVEGIRVQEDKGPGIPSVLEVKVYTVLTGNASKKMKLFPGKE